MPQIVPVIIASAFTTTVTAISGFVGGALFGSLAFTGAALFISTAIGVMIYLGAAFLLMSAITGSSRPNGASLEASKSTVRVNEAPRWVCAGNVRQGGNVLFAEFDSSGDLWVLVVHCDSRYTGTPQYYLDDVPISIDSEGHVTNNDFNLTTGKEYYTGVGTKVPYFQIWTTTYTGSDPTPPAITAFKAAFPTMWTDDHLLVGTTYSVLHCAGIDMQNRYKVYRWRGPLGLGEPALSIVADWSEPYDPRTGMYGFTTNPALIWAWFRTHPFGYNKSFDSIDWVKIAEQADICDETVVGLYGSQKRYECSIAIAENKERSIAEQEILITADAQVMFSDDGKAWCRVGYYEAPTLRLSRNRDIIAMDSVEAQNGESITQGVQVRYTDPSANFSPQTSAPWYNPNHYIPGEAATFLTVDALGVQNHNQAMRIAKAVGMRSQPIHKIVPTIGLRGLKARQERLVELVYDNTFAGDYEIVTPVEVDQAGVFCGCGMVPVDTDRWTLLTGEEKAKPVNDATDSTITLTDPTITDTQYVDGKIYINFTPTNDAHEYEFQYILTADISSGNWIPMTVEWGRNIAVSGTVSQNVSYTVRYRTKMYYTVSAWSSGFTVTTGLISLTGTPVTTATVGTAYTGFTVSASGGTTPYIFVDYYGTLPAGISINSITGVVSGTPTSSGTYSGIILRATDALGYYNDFPSFTITVT